MHIIVGIDPGTTSAIAALDLRGSLVASWSAKDAGQEGIISQIVRAGKPSLIACDVFPVPDAVSKIAAQFNVRVFSPEKPLTEHEKEQIASASGAKFRNSHERDAFASALKAYRLYANRLRQIDLLDEFEPGEKDRLKDLVLNGYSLKNALLSLAAKEEKPLSAQAQAKSTTAAKPKDLSRDVASLASENAELRKALERLELGNRSLLHRLRLLENGVFEKLRRDSEFRKLRAECERLRATVRSLFSRLRKPHHAGSGAKAEKAAAGLKGLAADIDLEKLVEDYRSER